MALPYVEVQTLLEAESRVVSQRWCKSSLVGMLGSSMERLSKDLRNSRCSLECAGAVIRPNGDIVTSLPFTLARWESDRTEYAAARCRQEMPSGSVAAFIRWKQATANCFCGLKSETDRITALQNSSMKSK
jgi:hypothetical protein